MSDGTLSVRRRQLKTSETKATDPLRSSTFESFLGTSNLSLGEGISRGKTQFQPLGSIDELRVESRRTKRLRDYDKLLKNFKYSAALDSVLRKVCFQSVIAQGLTLIAVNSKSLQRQHFLSFKS